MPRVAGKKKSPLRIKLTKRGEGEVSVTADEDHSNHPRVQTGLLKTSYCCSVHTQLSNCLHDPHTHTHTHMQLLRNHFFTTQLHVHIHTTLHSWHNRAHMPVCTHTHARVTIKYTCWDCDSGRHLDNADCVCVSTGYVEWVTPNREAAWNKGIDIGFTVLLLSQHWRNNSTFQKFLKTTTFQMLALALRVQHTKPTASRSF